MKRLYRILRSIIVSLLSLAAGIPIFLYLLLWLGPVHEKIRTTAVTELSTLLGADVTIERLRILPFTRIELENIAVTYRGDTLLTSDAVNAGISGRNLLMRGRIVITDVELMGPRICLNRDSVSAPLNAAPVLARLKGNGSKQPSKFSLAVHTVVIRGGRASYDVISAKTKPEGQFDPMHISLSDLNADLTAPRISNNDIRISLKRLSLREHSGLRVKRLSANVTLADSILTVGDLGINLDMTGLHFADMALDLRSRRIGTISLLRGSAIYPGDLAPLYAPLASLPAPIMADASVTLLRDSISIASLNISVPDHTLNLAARADATNSEADVHALDLGVSGDFMAETIGLFTPLKPGVRQILNSMGNISFTGSGSWKKPAGASLKGLLATDVGTADIDAALNRHRLHGSVETSDLDLATLIPGKKLGRADISAMFDLSPAEGTASIYAGSLGWNGHDFKEIAASANYDGKRYGALVSVDDSLATATAGLLLDLTPGAIEAAVNADIDALSPAAFGILQKYDGHTLSAHITARSAGPEPYMQKGEVNITGMRFVDATGNGLVEHPIRLSADLVSEVNSVTLSSDFIDASAVGSISLPALGPALANMLADALPQYFTPQPADTTLRANDFTLTATIHDNAPLLDFINLPFRMLYPASIAARVSQTDGYADMTLSAPYLQKGSSLIAHTSLSATLGSKAALKAHTVMPSKFGDMTLDLDAGLADGRGNIAFSFSNNKELKHYGGRFDIAVKPLREGADINILPGSLTLGNVDWSVEPAFIGVRGKSAIVNGLSIQRPGQELTIRGSVSQFPDDRLTIKLDNINLDYIFQTLQMAETVQFGGDASGTVTASALLSPEPILQTNDLYAKNFSYGHCVMGDARVRSRWNNETRGIEISADVTNSATDGLTRVDGVIYPLSSELDFHFKAHHTPVGFLRTFMSSWASGVGGTASGHCHLYGNFKLVDMTGDFMAEDFALTVGFTNVTYYATDSIHIRPGIIDLNGITVRDHTGRTGKLNGSLTHDLFQNARFDFRVSELDRILVLDTRPTDENDRWYGTIRANGTVGIKGIPGKVSISADASTAPGSEFTFVLTDAASAAEYTFLTFRDVTSRQITDTIEARPGSPELDRIMRERVAKAAELADASNYEFDLQVDVTPDARMNLIMDPNAGDRITGNGAGHIGVVYGSTNDEMRLYGDYRIDKGDYNFSLQDIILKNFTISNGSEVSFHGDPMDAQLDISAVYQVNANLSDLDESFLNDKEVQRTNVPVYAVLNVNGSLQEPIISFDLDFPTLTSDVKRKVKSIVSTDEMMNRQIIYLLALNRFYTPDYMNATKGNDLMSVASGTISSQLSNLLGQLSDKISVAPSVRTESGDFSDVEFDVALSSTLLNNRLLLNGNLGYRDKALNNNQFIGDFDVEYLLNRQGNWRLKAYNHFNDRNLYVKTALTTQGLGLVFKHDFDRLFRRPSQK